MRKLSIVMLLVLMIFLFASCTQIKVEYEELSEGFSEGIEYSLESTGVCEYDLKTRSSGVVGKMKVWNDANYLYVELTALAPWTLTEAYFDWAESTAKLPRTNRVIDINLFDYKFFGNAQSTLFTVPRAGMPSTIVFAEAATFIKPKPSTISWLKWYLRDRQGVCIYKYSF